MKLKAEYDPEAKAMYISIVDPPRDKEEYGTTIEKPLYGIFAMDLTRKGDIEGYEFLDIDLEILEGEGTYIDLEKDESNTTSTSDSSGERKSGQARRDPSRRSHSGDSRSR